MARPVLNYYTGYIPAGKIRVCLRVLGTERIDTLAEAAKVAMTYVELLRERCVAAGVELTADPPTAVVIFGSWWATVVLTLPNTEQARQLIGANDLVDVRL